MWVRTKEEKMKTKQFEITSVCNLNCEFCYNRQDRNRWKKYMSIYFILDRVEKNDVVYIGGGEPMLYPSLDSLLEKLLDKNIRGVVISTNATVYKDLERKNDERLQLQISLPAITRKRYEEITGMDLVGVVLKNVDDYIGDFKGRVFINMPVYEKNYDEIDMVADYCREKNMLLRVRPIIEANGLSIDGDLKRSINRKTLGLMINGYGIVGVREDKRQRNLEYFIPEVKARYAF